MHDLHDLRVSTQAGVPLLFCSTVEEQRVVKLISSLSLGLGRNAFSWTITRGLEAETLESSPMRTLADPTKLLLHIKVLERPGLFALLDFHPYLENPMHIRLLKEIALGYQEVPRSIYLIGHKMDIPEELLPYSAEFRLSIPDRTAISKLVREVAEEYAGPERKRKVKTSSENFERLVDNLVGLTGADARRLARGAIFDDGAITECDAKSVMQARYDLLDRSGALSFEYDTAHFNEVAGLAQLKQWLTQRESVFKGASTVFNLEPPRGVLLLGVQGCGKSLAAKAIAGAWGVPLLRLDFGAAFNKFIGETERQLREALQSAETLAPCILWLDEIEKGLGAGDFDGGTSKRVLGTLLTWMAERKAPVFMVATANDIEALPPELVRKGRFDELFFVNLPTAETRKELFTIHLKKRNLDPEQFDLGLLAEKSEGFSGAEIEQAIVASLYHALALKQQPEQNHLLAELQRTRPLSVTMAERIRSLQQWAAERCVPAD